MQDKESINVETSHKVAAAEKNADAHSSTIPENHYQDEEQCNINNIIINILESLLWTYYKKIKDIKLSHKDTELEIEELSAKRS